MSPQLLKALLQGQYICPVSAPAHYEELQDVTNQDGVNRWLGALNMRLARLGEDGAFFMAPSYISSADESRLRDELLSFRDVYGLSVQFLDFVRQTHVGQLFLAPAEYLVLHQIEEAVSSTTMLESLFKELHSSIPGASARNSHHENLRKMLDHLVKDGYLVLVSKETGRYQVTGKIEHLYAVLQFLAEQQVLPDDQEASATDDELDLADEARMLEADEPPSLQAPPSPIGAGDD